MLTTKTKETATVTVREVNIDENFKINMDRFIYAMFGITTEQLVDEIKQSAQENGFGDCREYELCRATVSGKELLQAASNVAEKETADEK